MTADDAWQAHAEEQQRRWQQLTPAERLRWLWQAKLFALRVSRARGPR